MRQVYVELRIKKGGWLRGVPYRNSEHALGLPAVNLIPYVSCKQKKPTFYYCNLVYFKTKRTEEAYDQE